MSWRFSSGCASMRRSLSRPRRKDTRKPATASLPELLFRLACELVIESRRDQLRQLAFRLVLLAELLQRFRQQPARLRLEVRSDGQAYRPMQQGRRLAV